MLYLQLLAFEATPSSSTISSPDGSDGLEAPDLFQTSMARTWLIMLKVRKGLYSVEFIVAEK